jgi:TonB family protein
VPRDSGLFGIDDRVTSADPGVDAVAASIRPAEFGRTFARSRARRRWSAASVIALASVVTAHAGVLAAVAYQRNLPSFDAATEIPVEIVIEQTPAVAEPPARMAALPVETAPANELKAVEDPTIPEPRAAGAAEPPQAEPAAQTAEDYEEPERAFVAALPPEFSPAARAAQDAADARRAAETEQAAQAERARRERDRRAQRAAQEKAAQEKAEAERERRAESAARKLAEARRVEAKDKREQSVHARQQVASLSPQGRTPREAPRETFDAASYRAIVARAVSAAVGRSCPSAGGGRVVVALLINASGQIASASLSSASGNGALDSAAVAAVRRAGPFPTPSGRSNVSVPVAVTCR